MLALPKRISLARIEAARTLAIAVMHPDPEIATAA